MYTVLIVSDRPSVVRSVEDALDESRVMVMRCPGPHAPDGQCVGTRFGRCPLVPPADVVVLDLDLQTDVLHEGASAADLLSFYRAQRRPVIGIAEGAHIDRSAAGDMVALLHPNASPEQIVRAVDDAVRGR